MVNIAAFMPNLLVVLRVFRGRSTPF